MYYTCLEFSVQLLRRGLPSKQAGLGIQLQNNYRCKENTFPLRKKLDDIQQSSVG